VDTSGADLEGSEDGPVFGEGEGGGGHWVLQGGIHEGCGGKWDMEKELHVDIRYRILNERLIFSA
jgi:hypothetical protein